MQGEEILSLKEAAVRSGLSAGHLAWLAKRGRIAAQKLGRDWFTTWAAVQQYLNDPEKRSRDPQKYRQR